MYEGSSASLPLPNLSMFIICNISYGTSYHTSITFMTNNVNIFRCTYLPSVYFIWWCVRTFCLFFCLVASFLIICSRSFYVFQIKVLFQVHDWQILSPSLFLVVHSLNSVFQVAEDFYLNVVQFIMLFFLLDDVSGVVSKNLCLTVGQRDFLPGFLAEVLLF